MDTASGGDELTVAQKDILRKVRLELCKLTNMLEGGKDRLHPMSDEYEIVDGMIEQIESLLGY